MSTFLNMRTTSLGAALLANVHAGTETLTIKYVVFGGGQWSAEQQASADLSALVDLQLSVSPSGVNQSGGQAMVNCTLDNTGLAAGFNLTEIGVIAETTGGDILYMCDYVVPEKSTWIPPEADYPVSVPIEVIIACSSSHTVEVVFNSTVPVTVSDLAAHDGDDSAHPPIWAALASKASSSHPHVITDVTNLQSELDNKAASSHSHGIANVTGLQTALDSKAASSHSHGIANVTGLQAALDSKAPANHSHTSIETDYISGGAMTPSVNSAAKTGKFEYGGRVYQGIAFPEDADSTVEFEYPMPETWNRGTVKVKALWAPASGASAGDTVSLNVRAKALSNGDAMNTALTGGVTVSDAVLADGDFHEAGPSAALTVEGSPGLSDLIKFTVMRDVSQDNMAEDMILLGIWIQYTCNQAVAAW